VIATATSEQLEDMSKKLFNSYFISHDIFIELYLTDMLSIRHYDYLDRNDFMFVVLFHNEIDDIDYIDTKLIYIEMDIQEKKIMQKKRAILKNQTDAVINKVIEFASENFAYIPFDKQEKLYMEFFEKNYNNIEYINPKLHTYEMRKLAVKHNSFNLDYVIHEHQTQELCNIAVLDVHCASFRNIAPRFRTNELKYIVGEYYEHILNFYEDDLGYSYAYNDLIKRFSDD